MNVYFLCHLISRLFSSHLFSLFLQTVGHGFPHQPSALAFDPKLQLMAIGTKSGAIKMYPFLSGEPLYQTE